MKTKIIKIDGSCKDIEKKLSPAADAIKRGGLVVFPTETVYGLGGDATSSSSAEKIYEAKNRPSDNPLIIHISEPGEAEKYTYTTDLYYKLAEKFMPGPLTVILRARENIPRKTRGGLETVAVRCPSHPVARALISMAGVPIAAPSANLSGSPSPTSPTHVIDDMNGRVDFIIDGGDSDFGLESTIVKINSDGSLTLLRPGAVTLDMLSEVCDRVDVAAAVTEKLGEGERVLSPGMKYRHYAPVSPVILLDGKDEAAATYIIKNGDDKVAVLSYTERISFYSQRLPRADIYDFGSEQDEGAQAHRLFSILRDADKKNYRVIYAPLPKKEGIGLALYNRMIRAAAYTVKKL